MAHQAGALNTVSPSAARLCEATGTGAEMGGEVSKQGGPIGLAYRGAPAHHLGDLAAPSRLRQLLRRNQVAAVATQAAGPRHVRAGPGGQPGAVPAGAADCADNPATRTFSRTAAVPTAARHGLPAARRRDASPHHYFTSTRTLSDWFHR